MKLLLLLLLLIFFFNNKEMFVNIDRKLIVKNINGGNKLTINLTDYNNINIGKIFNGANKIKISIPDNFKAIITYRYDDSRLFAFNLELPNGDYIIDRYVRKTMIDKIKPNIIIVFAWNYYDEILKNNTKLVEDGVRFINIKDLENENFDCSTNV